MKILILQEDFPPHAKGGGGAIAASYARAYACAGHEVAVLTVVHDQSLAGTCIEDGLRIERVYSNYHVRWRAWRCLYNPPTLRAVRRVLRDFKPDVVHAHNVHQHISYFALVLAERSGARVVLTCHDVQSFNYDKLHGYVGYRVSAWRQLREQRLRYNPFRNLLIHFIFKRYVDTVVAVSNALREALQANGLPVHAVIHNGIDAKAWEDATEPKNGTVLFTGGDAPYKGYEQITEAMRIVRVAMPQAVLCIVGRGSEAGTLSQEELRRAYHGAALVVVPSTCFDSFPTVNLEAMACRRPVIATSLGGSREAVVEGETGYILDPFDAQAWAQKIVELLSDDAKAKKIGEAGYERVTKEFTLEKAAKKLLDRFANSVLP